MSLPYNPFLSGPNAESLVQPGDRVVLIPADKVPTDRSGFNHLAVEPEFNGDADLFYSAYNWLGFMAVAAGEIEGVEGDLERIRHLANEDGSLTLIHTLVARMANLDIRA